MGSGTLNSICLILIFSITIIRAEIPWFLELNHELRDLNHLTAQVEWRLATRPNSQVARMAERVEAIRSVWRNNWCQKPLGHERVFELLCRGPSYTPMQARLLSRTLGELHAIYTNSRLCMPKRKNCFPGEPHLERIMREVRTPEILLWAWQGWRRAVGPRALHFYPTLVTQLNQGARNNGYSDLGECWREELEMKDVEIEAQKLMEQIQPLYRLLHAVTRHALRVYYGPEEIPEKGPIPAHLLGNMWAQNWASIADLVLALDPELQKADARRDITDAMHARNYTLIDMVRQAEDYYVSLGLEPMSPAFWLNSQMERQSANASCHASAVNMFTGNDFRFLLCAQVTEQDFYVIHHEMGHIQYYMAYRHQPIIFQDGANSAFQEAIGDAIWYGVSTPQHMDRLGLIKDTSHSDAADLAFLVRQAMDKLPQVPFSLAVDLWRYEVFRGNISPQQYNEKWWHLRENLQGIASPIPRSKNDFDPASKFHISENTPYIRYFFSNILQMQMFKALCQMAITGKVDSQRLNFPLHRCDIYGSKEAGKRLRAMMELGRSRPWPEALARLTNTYQLTADPLLEYYAPLIDWLEKMITRLRIPVDWTSNSY